MIAQTLETRLFAIEERFWTGSRADFLAHLAEKCLLVFPQAGEMHGVFSREEVADTVSTAPGRWRDLSVTDHQLLQLSADIAVIAYRADVKRDDGEPYKALVSSTYVRRADGWKLAAHQHSPL